MSRYFVALKGTRSGVLYVIAEVVREPGDEGHDREISLAGNLAGADAMIVTEDEIRLLPGGRVALEHWRSNNDTSFMLDTLAHDLDMGPLRGVDAYPPMNLQEARLVVEHNRQLARDMLKNTEAVREESRVAREALQETMEKVQTQRSQTSALLDAIGKQMHKPTQSEKRRHLRSVS